MSEPDFPIELNRCLRFGTHLFVNPTDAPEILCRRLDVLAEAGFRLIRLFLPWSQLEPKPGIYNWSPYSEVFDAAEARGQKIVATLMAVSPPGWMGKTRGLQDVADLDDPLFFEESLGHLRKVVSYWKDHPALDSWILWNEPCRELRRDQPQTWEAFQNYLAKLYEGDIEAYNACHFQPASSFSSILPPASTAYETGFSSHRDGVEWLGFTVENLQDKLMIFAAEVRKLDHAHPIHVNPHRVSQCLANLGQSLWQQAKTVDFMGCSAHSAWHSVRFPRERYGDSIAMFADLARSATLAPDGYFWVTELQGGSTLMSAFQSLAPTPAEARVWLWQCVGAGAKAVVYWCANARQDGYEAGEWDLLGEDGQPSARLAEITRTIRRLEPNLAALSKALPPRPDVGILVSDESQILDWVEGTDDLPANPRNRQKGADAAAGAYLMAADLSLEVCFYDPAALRTKALHELPQVLLVPNLIATDEATIEYLIAAANFGCLVVADGFFAWKDAYGRLATPTLRRSAATLWGAECLGYEAVSEADFHQFQPQGHFCRALFKAESAQVIHYWADRLPLTLLTRIGQGSGVRIGTQFFQRYFSQADPEACAWFAELVEPFVMSPRLITTRPGLRMRRLRKNGGGELVVVINSSSETQHVAIRLPLQDGRTITAEVPAQDGRILDLWC